MVGRSELSWFEGSECLVCLRDWEGEGEGDCLCCVGAKRARTGDGNEANGSHLQ